MVPRLTQGLQVCKWYVLWGLKSINRTYFGLFGALGYADGTKGWPHVILGLGFRV